MIQTTPSSSGFPTFDKVSVAVSNLDFFDSKGVQAFQFGTGSLDFISNALVG